MHDTKQRSLAAGRIVIGSRDVESRSNADAARTAQSMDKFADCEFWYLSRLMTKIAGQR